MYGVVGIDAVSRCGADDGADIGEQIGAPLGSKSAGNLSVGGCRPQFGDSNEGGHLFQSDRGHHSNLMAASSVSSRGPVLVMSWRRSPGQVFAQGLG